MYCCFNTYYVGYPHVKYYELMLNLFNNCYMGNDLSLIRALHSHKACDLLL